MKSFTVIFALVGVCVFATCAPAGARVRDVTDHVETLGIPLKARYPSGKKTFARNVWDLKAYRGRIYIGSGNSNNKGPAKNAGPAEVWYYHTRLGKFVKEGRIPDEQIDMYRIIDGTLIIPGHDPRGINWTKGQFYRLHGAKWQTVRTLPWGIHNYDMITFGSRWYAALGTPTGGKLVRSKDRGGKWRTVSSFRSGRIRTLFVLGGRLHASAIGLKTKLFTIGGSRIYVLKKKKRFLRRRRMTLVRVKKNFFPGVSGSKKLFVARPVHFKRHTIYLGARPDIDHNWIPRGLFAARSSKVIRRLRLPLRATPRDLAVDKGSLYVLATRRISNSAYDNYVYQTHNLSKWTPRFRFRTRTFARSFELHRGDFYFGLGCEAKHLSPATGTILRIKARVARGASVSHRRR